MNNYIVKPLGDMYLLEVTADDIRLALIPLSQNQQGYIQHCQYAFEVCVLFGGA